MVVQAGMGFYHVGAANTNRTVTYTFESGVANAFGFLRGNQPFYPFTGQSDTWNIPSSASTVNQQIANYRADWVVRTVTIYAPPVKLEVINGSQTASMIKLTWETSVSNVFPSASDITDTLGLAGGTAKTKSGLQTLATSVIATASLDGGTTLLFSANPNLANGTASTAAAITSITVAAA